MKSAIDEKSEKHYTNLRNIFKAINNKQLHYNWLITDCEWYSENEEVNEMLSKEHLWISGEELTRLIELDDFQWIWAIISGFPKDLEKEDVLKYNLPHFDGYEGYWEEEVKMQHPLAKIEIVAFDSSLTIFISSEDALVDMFRNEFPLSEDLSERNVKKNAQIRNIEKNIILEFKKRNIILNDNILHKKYAIWRSLYASIDTKVNDENIYSNIISFFNLK